MAQTVKTTVPSLEDAANLLLSQLDDAVKEVITILEKDYTLAKWQIICGVILDSFLSGHLSAFTLDPAWLESMQGANKEKLCPQCKKLFKPTNVGQVFCSNTCGEHDAQNRKILYITTPKPPSLEVKNATDITDPNINALGQPDNSGGVVSKTTAGWS